MEGICLLTYMYHFISIFRFFESTLLIRDLARQTFFHPFISVQQGIVYLFLEQCLNILRYRYICFGHQLMLFEIVKIHASRTIILWFIFFGYFLFASASFINEEMNTIKTRLYWIHFNSERLRNASNESFIMTNQRYSYSHVCWWTLEILFCHMIRFTSKMHLIFIIS